MNPERLKIITDSTSALPKKITEEKGIQIVNFTVNFGKKIYTENVDIDTPKFLKLLETEDSFPKTSAINSSVYEKMFRKNLPDEMIILDLGSGFSETHKISKNTSEIINEEKNNKNKIMSVDTETLSMAQGFMAIRAAELRNQGKSKQEILEELDSMKKRAKIFAAFKSLDHLAKSGRAKDVANAALLSIVKVRPVVKIEGNKVKPVSFFRKRSDALIKLVEATKRSGTSEQLGVIYGGNEEDEQLARGVVDELKQFHKGNIYFGNIDIVTLTHAGPGVIAVVSILK